MRQTQTVDASVSRTPDTADRDPFTGVPHHRYVRCRLERVAE